MSLARDVTTVCTATLLSRLLGFFRDVGIAAVLGAGVLSDAYFAALQIPNLFRRLLAEGALNSAFVPLWLRIREKRGMRGTRGFAERVLGTMVVSLGVIAIICVIFAPTVVQLLAPGFGPGSERYDLAVDFVRLSVPYIAIAGPVAVAASILNAEGRVGAAAFALIIFNGVFVVAVMLVVGLGGKASFFAGAALSVAIVAAGFAQLLVVGGALMRQAVRPRRLAPRLSPEVRYFFSKAIPGVVAGAIASAQSRAFEIALALALPSAAAFAVLAEPIAGGLFERGAFGSHDTAMVAAALAAISAGLPGHVLEKVLGAVSFAHEDTRTPMVTALCGLTAATVGALLLFPGYGHVGVAAAIAFSGWVGDSALAVVLWRRGWLEIDRAAQRRLPRIVLATVAMAAAIMGGNYLMGSVLDITGSALARIVTLVVLV